MLGSLILYLKGMRIMMFQLSGFYCRFWSSGFETGFQGSRILGGGHGIQGCKFRVGGLVIRWFRATACLNPKPQTPYSGLLVPFT